jgi:hypothetical protein
VIKIFQIKKDGGEPYELYRLNWKCVLEVEGDAKADLHRYLIRVE